METYWLCDPCSREFRLEWRLGEGIVAVEMTLSLSTESICVLHQETHREPMQK